MAFALRREGIDAPVRQAPLVLRQELGSLGRLASRRDQEGRYHVVLEAARQSDDVALAGFDVVVSPPFPQRVVFLPLRPIQRGMSQRPLRDGVVDSRLTGRYPVRTSEFQCSDHAFLGQHLTLTPHSW
ncbi:MAG TPA: hypothetical protein DCM67_09555 [Propionibacteriaceae bacterium]|nr:hypothetical protein [Propionibacteriaceae bacterium]